MTVIQLIHIIKEDHKLELNSWQRQFIEDIYDGVDGLGSDTPDQEIGEFLTGPQINKVYEIAQELGIK